MKHPAIHTGTLFVMGFLVLALTPPAHALDIGVPYEGKATYYSVTSNGKKRDDGGLFNNADLIIGHKTLPLGTRVRITNLENRKMMVVTIDDNSEPGKMEADFVFSKTLFVKYYRDDWDSLFKGTMPIKYEVLSIPGQQNAPLAGNGSSDDNAHLETEEDDQDAEEPETRNRFNAETLQMNAIRQEISELRKVYEEANDPEILEDISILSNRLKRLVRLRRERIIADNARYLPYQVGVASFYSGRFNGRRTSTGETFSNQNLTAAHLTLPFGTKVLVKNPSNGHEVTVVINDRGPYIDGRIIDLSKEAFAQLFGGDWNSLSRGLTRVELHLIEE